MIRNIPVTAILQRYEKLKNLRQPERLAEAQRLLANPKEIADEFAESVAHFASYSNCDESFYGKRAERTFADTIKSTNDVTLRLKRQTQLMPTDAMDRRSDHDAGVTVTAVPSSQLACVYVDRELEGARTTSHDQWEDVAATGADSFSMYCWPTRRIERLSSEK